MRKLFLAACAFIMIASAAHAAPGAVRCGKLLDVRTGKILPDQIVLFDDGKITAVGAAASTLLPSGVRAIDLPQETCLPGLIDVHVHLLDDPTDNGYEGLGISDPRATIIGVRNARITLRAGFTTVRNVNAPGFADVALRDGINAGDVEGPRMLVSGPALTISGGHADNDLLPFSYHATSEGVCDGPWSCRQKVRENLKYGVDLIKVMASGGVLDNGGSPGIPQFSLEELQAIVIEAHKLGLRVVAHAHGTQSIKDAVRAGVDSVEHASLIDDEGLALAKEHGTYLVYDIYNDDYIVSQGLKAGMLPKMIEKEKEVGLRQRESFRRAVLAGEKIAFGTDAGVYPHGDNSKQFSKMVEWGMKPIEAIQAATINAADLLGWADKVGELAAGHCADLIGVDGDPTTDVRVLENVKFVMKGGAVIRNDSEGR
ncbi:MAG TPA: amidohydrolase family protein [Candidatus Acidoferrales bacterium]|nr:amidohydrolase family protein [Candidatus Acidoferrales bacterium]